ncbi:hypothetical protein [Micromonospora sp. AMSO12t]|uniref:hypothetical protein n=1 Tax=Micromonospora sp. AMSO12t TaxID=2650410 RepID=UPI001CEC6693|nr:hypothetical protein [Micromonospora sp. AMSO12t]
MTVPEMLTEPADDGHAPVGVPGLLVGLAVGLLVGPLVGLVVGVDPPLEYVSNSAIRGVPDALVMTKEIFFSDVEEKLMVPGALLPLARTEPVSWFLSCQPLIEPPPEACTMAAEDTVVALPHLTETVPVEPLGDQ